MTSKVTEYNSIAPLRNVAGFMTLLKSVQNRGRGLPGMGTFYGPSGFGKSTAATYAANAEQAYLVVMRSVWTRKNLCQAILTEMGLSPVASVAGMVDQISEELATTGRPLLIDEADVLVTKKMVEMVRDIYEMSFAPVILIGEELLPQKLKQWERVHGRMLRWTAAEQATEQDYLHLHKLICGHLDIDEGVSQQLLKLSRGSVRRICINLDLLRDHARLNGLDHITSQNWTGTFYTGEAPSPRRGI